MDFSKITSYNPGRSFGLSQDAKNCILRVMGKEAQALIDQYEAAEREQAMKADPNCSIMPNPLKAPQWSPPASTGSSAHGHSIDELNHLYTSGKISGSELAGFALVEIEQMPGLKERCEDAHKIFDTLRDDAEVGKVARIGLALMGEADFPSNIPHDSLLDRCRRHSRPSTLLYPAIIETLKNCRKSDEVELIDIAEKIFNTIPLKYEDERPMEKAYAGMRVLVTLAGSMGKLKVADTPGLPGHFSTPLRNLKDDGQTYTMGVVYGKSVNESFDELRQFLKKYKESEAMIAAVSEEGPPKTLTIDMDPDDNFVSIGGVKLAINR